MCVLRQQNDITRCNCFLGEGVFRDSRIDCISLVSTFYRCFYQTIMFVSIKYFRIQNQKLFLQGDKLWSITISIQTVDILINIVIVINNEIKLIGHMLYNCFIKNDCLLKHTYTPCLSKCFWAQMMFTFFGKRYNETQWLYWSSDIQFERYIH